MQGFVSILVFLLILGSIIIIHELGHFLAAKFFGVYCHQFSIGFGPKIWSKKGNETEYELRLLPFGGFVSMAGEEDQKDEDCKQSIPYERTLQGIKTYQKVIIFLAGVFMNFILTLVVLFCLNISVGRMPVQIAQVGDIIKDSPAEKYGLEVDDIIQKVDIVDTNQSFLVSSYEDMQFDRSVVDSDSSSITMIITVQRDNKTKKIKLVSDYNTKTETYQLGIVQATQHMNFTEAVRYTFIGFYQMSTSIFTALGLLITKFRDTVTQLSGPVGIYTITKEVTQTGQIANIFNLLALLSVNIGIFNLLPIPGLDGCQVLFAIVEKIIGREIPDKLKVILQMIGLGLVILLMVFVTFQDISRLFG